METPLRRARRAAGLTTTVLAERVGINQANISRLERGLQTATPQLAEALARELGNVTELEILYPERYIAQPAGQEAV